MGRNLFGRKRCLAILAVAAVILIAIFAASRDSSNVGRAKLPTGSATPAIVLGERHGLIIASDGSLWAWGSDSLGWPAMGLGKRQKSVQLRRIGSDTNWVNISASESRSVGIKTDGTIWSWGASIVPRHTLPRVVPLPTLAAPGNDWKQAAVGSIQCVGLKRDGTLWGWGNNWAGSVGIPQTNGSLTPVQIGTNSNWVKVWARSLETVGLQADGSLWYWGDNPDPTVKQDVNATTSPQRVNADTNWVDVGFGVNTVFAIKSDGTLWVWGRQAHAYTGVTNKALNTIPARVGTNDDWVSISASPGWWCQGLVKRDGSVWMLDASQGRPNGPNTSPITLDFRRLEVEKGFAAFAAGATHGAAPGVHGPIVVALKPDGEVWTSGMVLGDPESLAFSLQATAVDVLRFFHVKVDPPDPPPIFRDKPWQLRNIEPGTSP